MIEGIYTTGQVAKVCGVSKKTVVKWFDSGMLKGFRIPGSLVRRIPKKALIKFMKEYNIISDFFRPKRELK